MLVEKMNAIEQMMQAFGAGSAQQVTAMFGTSAAAESNAVDFANQFAAALQNNELAINAADSPWRLSKNPALSSFVAPVASTAEGIEGLAANFTGALQSTVVSPTFTNFSADQRAFNDVLAAKGADAVEAIEGAFEPYAEGIPGLQLVQLTGVELSALVNSGQLQSLGTELPNLADAGNDLFVFAAGSAPDQPLRLLPLAQLEPLVMPNGQPVVDGQVKPDAAGIIAQQAEANIKAPAADGKPAVVTHAADIAKLAPTPEVAKDVAAADLANKVVADQSSAAAKTTASETFRFAADYKNAEAHGAQANADKKPDAEKADGQKQNIVVNQQKAAQSAAQNTAPTANAAANQAATAAPQAAAATAAVQPSTSTSNKPATATPTALAPKQKPGLKAAPAAEAAKAAPQQAPITWTPERVAGVADAAIVPSEAIAGGLTGLRGESSFMNAMGLMGGKPSAALGGHIAKQINMQITRAVSNGTQEFNMRLNPAELGGLKIKMAFTDAGRVSAQIMVERPETLELLQREVRGMERAVEAGGHKMASEGISFNLDTGDGQSAGKAFAEAMQQDKHEEKMATEGGEDGQEGFDEFDEPNDLTDLAALEEILSRVSPDTGLDVRV
jgi:flagellar hook-length control protein FliK